MRLSQEMFDTVPLNLGPLQDRVIKLELVPVAFDTLTIMEAIHRDYVLLAAEGVGGDLAPLTTLASDNINWLLTGDQNLGWRLAIREGDIFNHTVMHFMAIPVSMPAESIATRLAALRGRLPYLEITVDGPMNQKSGREIRGLYLTAMALLHGLLPEEA